jgi:hypothetical protein
MAYTGFLPIWVLLLLCLIPRAATFGTVNGIGQHAEHEKITRAALGCNAEDPVDDCFRTLSLDELAGKTKTVGAIGAPDINEVCIPDAHCDDADYFEDGFTTYPQTRSKATAALQNCLAHLKKRYEQGLDAAQKLLDSSGKPSQSATKIPDAGCNFLVDATCLAEICIAAGPEFALPCFAAVCFGQVKGCPILATSESAKCDAIAGFGKALHGFQDFYSHSNWVDEPVTNPGLENPPGLGMTDVAPFLTVDSDTSLDSFPNLITGCFATLDQSPGVLSCSGRITHNTLNKDKGEIVHVSSAGVSVEADTTRGQAANKNFGSNYAGAVQLAINETRRQWESFKADLRRIHGPDKGFLMICAMTRDNPEEECCSEHMDTDPLNCGHCGNKCESGKCKASACVPVEEPIPPERPTWLFNAADYNYIFTPEWLALNYPEYETIISGRVSLNTKCIPVAQTTYGTLLGSAPYPFDYIKAGSNFVFGGVCCVNYFSSIDCDESKAWGAACKDYQPENGMTMDVRSWKITGCDPEFAS